MRGKKILLGIVIAALLISDGYVLMNAGPKTTSDTGNAHSWPKPLLRGTHHAPIIIHGDSDLTEANGVTYDSVNGYYCIRDYIIDGNGSYGIYVSNINQTLIISYCEVYNASSAIMIDHVSYTGSAGTGYVTVADSYIHNTSSAAVYIQYSGQAEKSGDTVIVEENWIFNASKAGVYAGVANNVSVADNSIFHNDVGVHFYHVSNGSIWKNGIGENTDEGVRMQSSEETSVKYNIFYHNNGTADKYNPKYIQATETSSTGWIEWERNYWHDWAMNNDTNWYYKNQYYTEVMMKWGYPIIDSSGNIVNHDYYPFKVVHVEGSSSPDHASVIFENPYDMPGNMTGPWGFVSGLGTQSEPFKIVGVEYNLTDEPYGVVVRLSGYYVELINVWAHNATINNGGDGYGFEVSSGTVKLEHVNAYNCSMAGILADDNDVTIENSYIHNNMMYGIESSEELSGADVYVYNTTIDSNTFEGIYFNSTEKLLVQHSIVSNNGNVLLGGDGIFVTTYNSRDVYIYNSSFFNNVNYGLYVNNSDGSKVINVYMRNNIFHGNNGAKETYSSSHKQVYIGLNTHIASVGENFYNDWVYSHPGFDTKISKPYTFDGTGSDDSPVRWVNFTGMGAYIYESGVNSYQYYGTQKGITGYDEGSDTYWIEGWRILNPLPDGNGIEVSYADSTVYIKGCDVSNIYSGDGIYVNHMGSHVYIYNNTISNNGYDGIRASSTSYINIGSNRVFGNGEHGVDIYGIDSGFPSVVENTIYSNNGAGVYLYGISGVSKYSSVSYNQISHNDIGIETFSVSTMRIIHNGLVFNTHYGVKLHNSNGMTIQNNSFYKNNNTRDKFNPKYIQAYDDGNNFWNDSAYGNFWYDWAMNNGTNDGNNDNTIDWAYPIDGGAEDNRSVLFFKHAPMSINGLVNFTYDNGVIGGIGTSDSPYVIAGWSIKANGYESGIYLSTNSPEYETLIDDCSVSGANKYGIYIDGYYPSNLNGPIITINNTSSMYNGDSGLYMDVVGRSEMIEGYAIVHNSYFAYNDIGIRMWLSDVIFQNVTASQNTKQGFFVYQSSAIIENSTVYKNGEGIVLEDAFEGGKIVYSVIKENTGYGVNITGDTHGFLIYHNQFTGNNGASETGTYSSDHIQAYDSTYQYNNSWNTTTEGNCWSDYTGTGAYAIDGGSSKDYYPDCTFVPEFNSIFIAIFLVALLGVILWRKH